MDTLLIVYLSLMTLSHAWGVVASGKPTNPVAMVVNAVLLACSLMLLAERLL